MIEDITGTCFIIPSLCHTCPATSDTPAVGTRHPVRTRPGRTAPFRPQVGPWPLAPCHGGRRFENPGRTDSTELRMQGNARSTKSYMGPFASTRRT